MSSIENPVPGNWYRLHDKNRRFMVISVEKDRDLIKLQYPEGDFQEISFAEWSQLELHPSDDPGT